MAKSLDKTKFALKLRTSPLTNGLTLRLGVRKYVLPFDVRTIQNDEYVFVHVPPAAELLKFEGKGLKVVTDAKEAEAAAKGLRRTRKKAAGRAKKAVEMPKELEAALKKLPSGMKLGYDADGRPRLVKMRKPRK